MSTGFADSPNSKVAVLVLYSFEVPSPLSLFLSSLFPLSKCSNVTYLLHSNCSTIFTAAAAAVVAAAAVAAAAADVVVVVAAVVADNVAAAAVAAAAADVVVVAAVVADKIAADVVVVVAAVVVVVVAAVVADNVAADVVVVVAAGVGETHTSQVIDSGCRRKKQLRTDNTGFTYFYLCEKKFRHFSASVSV